ncbi:MAG: DUF3127 domain-containing protein [Bacteroidaceae bacterium]|nr:DUF3127 domain-containing protein [Bacteroidaceae bacterium]
MEITGKVIAQYAPKHGTYMGEAWVNQSFIITSTESHPDSNIHDRIVIKVKGKKLDEFLAEGVQNGGTYVFTLFFDAEERNGKDGDSYPMNKAVVCTGFKKV